MSILYAAEHNPWQEVDGDVHGCMMPGKIEWIENG
jgi:hypothetical protein